MRRTGIVVNDQQCQVLASILNDFGEGRVRFTFEDFVKAMTMLGFARRGKYSLIPPKRFGRKVIRLLNDDGANNCVVDPRTQDEWKLSLFRLYGWTAETFRAR
ncbi:hypothetical protein LXA43DRAFT_1102083 [Ganoderma leucocontextum]|nr:hypothetical protein LXA43DRAFT_1102083 [Ganoderma leucocontextum]